MPVQPAVYLDPPVVEPYLYGLFGAVQEIPWQDHFGIGGAEWESLAQYLVNVYPQGQGQEGGVGGTKSMDAYNGFTTAWPFAAYAGVICGSVGYTPQQFEDRITTILALSSQHATERALWAGGTGAPTGRQPSLNQTGTTDVTAGTATELGQALGLLENWLADHYAGRGYIHARRQLSTTAAGKQLLKDVPDANGRPSWQTPVGSRWIFGGGYDGTGPAAVAPAAGTTWIYATGAMIMSRGPSEMPAGFEEALVRLSNQELLIAEQSYIIGVDGTWAAAKIDLTK